MPGLLQPLEDFTSRGKLADQLAPWQSLQRYVEVAMNGTPSSDPGENQILDTLRESAGAFKVRGIAEANKLYSSVYGFAGFAVSSLTAVGRLMAADPPPYEMIGQILTALVEKANVAAKEAEPVLEALTAFAGVVEAAGGQANHLVTSMKKSFAEVKGMIQESAQGMEAHMSAALLDPAAVAADIAKIQQYATGLSEIPGLRAATLQAPLAKALEACNDATLDISAWVNGWKGVAARFNELLSKLKEPRQLTADADLSELQLAAAIRDWDGLTKEAHGSMLTFYVTAQE